MAQKIEVVIDGKNNAGKAIGEAGSQLTELGNIAKDVVGALGIALSVDAFSEWIKGSLDAAAKIQQFAEVSRASTAEFQRFAVGARTVGFEQEQLADIFKDVNEKVGEFLQTGGGELQDFFEGIAPQVGVTAEQFRNLSGPQALQLYASSLEKAGMNSQEMTFYLESMASDASKLMPLLKDNGAAFQAWADEAERMGLILSEDTIVQAAAFSEQLNVVGMVTENLGAKIGAAMLPSLQELSGLLIDVSGDAETAKIASDVFGTTLKILATTAIWTGSTIASVGRAIGGLAAAAVAAASGELSQAGEIIRQITADNQKSADDAEERTKKLWSGESQQAAQRAADLNKQVADSQGQLATAGSSVAAMTAKQKTEIKALNDELETEQNKLVDLSKEQETINKLKELGVDLTSKEAKQSIEKAKQLDSETKASEAKKKAEQEADSAAKKRIQEQAQLSKQQESYVAGLEKQAATLGLTTAQVRTYELAEKSLTGALSARAKAAQAALDAYEKQQQAEQNANTNAGLQADYLRATGQPVEAAMLEIENKFAQLRKQFVKDGNDAGLAMIDKLIPVEQAKAKLDGLQGEIDQAFERQSRGEQSIDTQVNAGLLTEMEGRQKLLDLHRQTADVIERYLPELEQMAQQPGPLGEQAAAEVARVRNALVEARSAATEFQRTLEEGLSSGIQNAVQGLADGTMNLRDAVTSLVSSVADAMLQLATQKLAEQATASIMGLLGGGKSDSSAQAAAITGASAVGAQSMAAAIVAAGIQAGSAMATAITAAGAGKSAGGAVSGAAGASGASGIAGEIGAASSQGAAEMGSSITAASETGSGTFSSALDSVFSGGADLFGNLFDSLGGLFGGGGGESIFSGILGGIGGLFGGGSVAAATGGHVTGPGTGTSDSIAAFLSNNEFVTRAAVVQQPGALDFLHAFNAQGMAALDDYARRVRHATGGLAGVPAPALPAPSLGTTTLAEPAKTLGGTTVQNSQNFSLVLDEDQIASSVWGKAGQQHFIVYLRRNASIVRSLLKV